MFEEASVRAFPRAIGRAERIAWLELVQTGRVDSEEVDLFGEASVLYALLPLQRTKPRPLDLRCAAMSPVRPPTTKGTDQDLCTSPPIPPSNQSTTTSASSSTEGCATLAPPRRA